MRKKCFYPLLVFILISFFICIEDPIYVFAKTDDGSQSIVLLSNIDEAATYLREEMVKRQEHVGFSISKLTGMAAEETARAIYDKALEETNIAYEGDYLYYHVLSEGYSVMDNEDNFSITYSFTYRTTYEQEQEVTNAVKEIIDELKITDNTSDYAKIRKIYNYICQNVKYDYDNLSNSSYELKYTAYAAAIEHKAVCQGVSLLMHRILKELDIDTRLITGTSMNQYHMWNIVCLKNEYYNLDATWDLGSVEYEYFLKSESLFYKDHSRDERCSSDAFMAAYPMAEQDYVVVDEDMGETYRLEYENIVYDIWEGEATVVGYTGTPVNVNIPEEVEGARVVAISNTAFSQCKSIQSVFIPKTVILIEDGDITRSIGAFAECDKLKSVKITDASKMLKIGEAAFFSCPELSNVVLQEGLYSIGISAFQECISLIKITLPDSLFEIGQNTFSDSGLLTIHLPKSLTELGVGALQTDSLESITVSEQNVSYFSDNGVLFFGDGLLVEYPSGKKDATFIVPDFVYQIEGTGFDNQYLETIVLGANSEISQASFATCKYFDVDPRNKFYDAIDGNLYTSDGEELLAIGKGHEETVIIPDGVKSIDIRAARYCNFNEIVLPDTIEEIKEEAFTNCKNLKTITMPSEMEKLGRYAFSECEQLTKIELPEGISVIEEGTFRQCSKLDDVIIPDSVYTIRMYAFDGCPCRNLVLPEHDILLEKDAFSIDIFDYQNNFQIKGNTLIQYTGIEEEIKVPEGITTISPLAFFDNPNIKRVILPDTIVTIGQGAFCNCDNLEYVYIPESVVNINCQQGDIGIFQDCPLLVSAGQNGGDYNIEFEWKSNIPEYIFYNSSLKSVDIPAQITEIGEGAFYDSSQLENVNISQTIQSIGDHAFQNTPWFEKQTEEYVILGTVLLKYNGAGGEISIPAGITEIADKAFYQYTTIESVSLPDSVIRIGEAAFEQCKNMKAINLPAGLQEFGERAFAYCEALSHLTIPDGITKIPQSAFDCSGLQSITLSKNIKIIEDFAFNYNIHLKEIKLQYGIEEIGKQSFSFACISELTIPGSIRIVKEDAFMANGSLEKLVVEDGVKEIGNGAFKKCNQLNNVILPASLVKASNVFTECPLLISAGPISSGKTIEYAWTDKIPSCAFLGNECLTEILLPEECTEIGTKAFYSCTDLQNVIIPEGVHKINSYAFGKCVSLADVNLPASLLEIGNNIFYQSDNLESIKYSGALEDWEKINVGEDNIWVDEINYMIIHDWELSETIPPTCTEVGEKRYICNSCGKERIIKTDAIGHNYGDWIIDKNATCMEPGSRHRVCINEGCNSILKETISIIAHSYSSEMTKPPTYTENGEMTYTCFMCKDVYTELIPMLSCPHEETVLQGGKQETCIEDGYTGDYVCTKCNIVIEKGEVVPAVGHKWDGGVQTKEPTCIEEGVMTYTCCVCDITKEESIPPTDHIEEKLEGKKEATCTEDGYTGDHVCTKCNIVIEKGEAVPAVGHKWDGGVQTKEPTYDKEGEITYTCVRCKSKRMETISKLSKPSNGGSDNNSGNQSFKSNANLNTENTSDLSGVSGPLVQSIRITSVSRKIAAGKKIKLSAEVFPANAFDKEVIWTTSNSKIATVYQNGIVKVSKKTDGKSVIITATAKDGSGISAAYKIKIMKGVVKEITIKAPATVPAGKSVKLKAKVRATVNANKKVRWISSNENYAIISNSGKLKTRRAGKGKRVKITAMATDGSNKKATVTIKLK